MPKSFRLGNQLVLFAASVLGAISVSPVTIYNQRLITVCWTVAGASVLAVLVALLGAPALRAIKEESPRPDTGQIRLPFSLFSQLLIVGLWIGMLFSDTVSHQHLEALTITRGVVSHVYTTRWRRRRTYVVLQTAGERFQFAKPKEADGIRVGHQVAIRIFRQHPVYLKINGQERITLQERVAGLNAARSVGLILIASSAVIYFCVATRGRA